MRRRQGYFFFWGGRIGRETVRETAKNERHCYLSRDQRRERGGVKNDIRWLGEEKVYMSKTVGKSNILEDTKESYIANNEQRRNVNVMNT